MMKITKIVKKVLKLPRAVQYALDMEKLEKIFKAQKFDESKLIIEKYADFKNLVIESYRFELSLFGANNNFAKNII